MSGLARRAFAAASVGLILFVVAASIALGPAGPRVWLVVSGVLAAGAAVQAVGLAPADLGLALLFSLPPVLALTSGGSPTWLIGPLGALLFVAAELGALSWECQGGFPLRAVQRRRLVRGLGLGGAGFVAALLIDFAASRVPLGSAPGLVLAAAFVAAAGALVFRGWP